MAEIERVFHFAPKSRTTRKCHDSAWLAVDPVSHLANRLPGCAEDVPLAPGTVWTGGLSVPKLAWWSVLLMLKRNADSERTDSYAKCGVVAVADRSDMFQGLDTVPRRHVAIVSGWPLMPSEYLLSRVG